MDGANGNDIDIPEVKVSRNSVSFEFVTGLTPISY